MKQKGFFIGMGGCVSGLLAYRGFSFCLWLLDVPLTYGVWIIFGVMTVIAAIYLFKTGPLLYVGQLFWATFFLAPLSYKVIGGAVGYFIKSGPDTGGFVPLIAFSLRFVIMQIVTLIVIGCIAGWYDKKQLISELSRTSKLC
ncbi:hypothetical protein ACFL0L_00915 [Patescibacteria group bacterium]